jgi:nucleoside-diphosphate-sugar epimerase
MRILVTGSNGFIGRALVMELRKQGHSVEGFDSSNGQSVLDLRQVKRAVKGKHAVYHLAAVLDEARPMEMLEVNGKGTENVIEASAKMGVGHFIYLSTAGVHGSQAGRINESTALKPETRYEASKAMAEKIVWNSQEMLPITILRSALVLGPNEYWGGIIKLIKRGFPLIGSGENRFQTIYVKDLVSAMVFVLGKEECFGEVYLVAGAEAPKLRELYGLIQGELGVKRKQRSIPIWAGKILAYACLAKSKISGKRTIVLPQHVQRLVRNREYDTGKITALGWKPQYDLKSAVKETVKGLE